MANVKISELTALTPPDAADLVPVTDSSASQTKRTTVGEIVGIINGDVDVANDGTATISELPVSKLQDGAARQLLQTNAAGTGVEWTSNIDVPGTLDVTGAATLDSTLGVDGQSTLASAAVSDLTEDRVVIAGASGELEDSANLTFNGSELGITGTLDVSSNATVGGDLTVVGDLTVEGATTTLETQTLVVEDKNIELGVVASPTDTTADGGGITLKGATDKTITWSDGTNAWTSSEPLDLPAGADTTPALFFNGDTSTGIYSPGADQVAISSNGTQRVLIDSDGDINIDSGGVFYDAANNRLAIGTTSLVSDAVLTLSADSDTALFFRRGSGTNQDGAIRFESGDFQFLNGANSSTVAGLSERVRIDRFGRLLAGASTAFTSAEAGAALVQIKGASGSTMGRLSIARDEAATSITSGEEIAGVYFTDNAGNQFSKILCYADANAGSGDYPGRLVFSTCASGSSSPTPRLIIGNQGFVFPDQTSADNVGNYLSTGVGGFRWVAASSTTTTRAESYATSTSARYHQTFVNPNGTVGSISTSASATAYNTSSDYRLKENVVPLTGAADRLKQIPVHRFNFIADPDTTVDGFIAHEAQAVVPECVTGEKDAVDDEGNPVYQGIDQSKLVPLLTAALQEALQKIENLEQRLNDAGIA